MTNTDRYEDIQAGCKIAESLDRELAKIGKRPLPSAWKKETLDQDSIQEVVMGIRRFDSDSQSIVRRLIATPVEDDTATLVLTAALLPAVIHRYRQRPHRIAEAITELALYIAERPRIGLKRHAANALIDEAARRYRTSLRRQEEQACRTESLTDHHANATTYSNPVAETAIANVQIESCRLKVAATHPNLDLDRIVIAGAITGLRPAARQQLSRARRHARDVLDAELLEVA